MGVHYLLLSRTLDQGAGTVRRAAEVELRLSPGALGEIACANGAEPCEAVEEAEPASGEVERAPVDASEIASEVQSQLSSQVLDSTIRWSGLLLLALAVVGGGAAFLIGKRVASPIEGLTAAARGLSTDRLHQRVPVDAGSVETKELAESFNEMLDRLDTAFTAQRRFVANASHQLKTPLAIMRTQLDVARRKGAADVPELFETVDQMVVRMQGLSEAMLRLARTEHVRASCDIEISPLAEEAVEELGLGQRVELQLQNCRVRGDRDLLREAIKNLLENAIVHGIGEVRVAVEKFPGNAVCVTIENGGPRIPPEEVQQLFEPFRKLEQRTSDSKGHGLGLSIVRSIIEAHGGRVSAEALSPGGLRVVLTLAASPGSSPLA